MKIRTDLATESAANVGDSHLAGIKSDVTEYNDAMFTIEHIQVQTEQAAQQLGKPVGNYVTIRTDSCLLNEYCDVMEERIKLIAKEIRQLCGNAESVLVAGLGNRSITPDAIGPLCSDRIFATRHIKELATEIDTSELTSMSVIQTGVLGQTGIEASNIVSSLCEKLKPDVVVAVDALACGESGNLGSTIQLTDTGISPGSGVANSRKELSYNTLGVRCIAVGVPTVMDMPLPEGENENKPPMMVTSRDVDRLAANSAAYISGAINLAFQPSLSIEDIQSLVW